MLTEKTFSLNGLGKYSYDAIITGDLPKILGVTLVAGFFVIMANLIVDLLYGPSTRGCVWDDVDALRDVSRRQPGQPASLSSMSETSASTSHRRRLGSPLTG